jgi:acetolactate synthase-1/2/3 large subunit
MQVNPNSRIIHLGGDPLFVRYPIRTFPAALNLQGDAPSTLRTLASAAARRIGSGEARARRSATLRAEHEAQRSAWRSGALAAQAESPIDFDWLSRCIGEVTNDETVLVNEYDLRLTQVDRDRPGFYSHPRRLSWLVSARLWGQTGQPNKTVVATVGDGAYIFSVPTAAHMVSTAYNLPILVVIFNNGCWGAVRKTTAALFPKG